MEKRYRNERIVFLTDYETKEGMMLANSFHASGIPIEVVSLRDNVPVCKFSLSVQEFVAGENCQGRPLYYNEIPIPQEWTVNYGENGLGQITYLGQARGIIHFLDCEKKYQVESVWNAWFCRGRSWPVTAFNRGRGTIESGGCCD